MKLIYNCFVFCHKLNCLIVNRQKLRVDKIIRVISFIVRWKITSFLSLWLLLTDIYSIQTSGACLPFLYTNFLFAYCLCRIPAIVFFFLFCFIESVLITEDLWENNSSTNISISNLFLPRPYRRFYILIFIKHHQSMQPRYVLG